MFLIERGIGETKAVHLYRWWVSEEDSLPHRNHIFFLSIGTTAPVGLGLPP
jgi:hypothetical protein